MCRLLASAALVAALLFARAAHADGYSADDTLAAIDSASQQTGVSAVWLARVVGCESNFRPSAIGRLGEQGPAQLYPGGSEWGRFFAAGYSDPFDPYQAVSFMAAEFALGRASAWSCR